MVGFAHTRFLIRHTVLFDSVKSEMNHGVC